MIEYVPGGSLRDLLEQEGRLSVGQTVEIALDVADALTRAHRLGIVHRDLKPSNVLLAEDGTPRLTDFGIAYVTGGPRLTGSDRAVGTVDYMSPEACNLEPLDARTDVWSFGVMLYEMLARQRPFAGNSPLTTLTAILTKPIPDLARLCPDAPDALVDLVYRMLEKDRSARIPSMRLVGAELEAILGAIRGQRSAVSGQGPAVSGQQSAVSGLPPSVHPPSSVVHRPSSPPTGRFATPTPPAERPRHNLPAQPTPFVGREAELVELERLLSDPSVRLVTVLGAGGMGKTRLALQAAEILAEKASQDGFAHGVFFVPLAPLQSADAIVPTVAQTLGFPFYEGGEPRQQLLDYLREKRMLLLLDNYEHLLAGVDLVADILRMAPSARVLVTSRARLGVQGEQLYHLAGMDYPDWETPEDALEYSAVKLFLQSARRAQAGFELEADDLQYISRICRLVGGMPLGILLAAAWIEMLTPAEIAAEIERGLDFLEDSARDMPERQHSVRAVFDHSWNLLAEREGAVFAELSVFRGGFTRDAAQEVTGASLRELRSLVDRSLLHRTPAGRYDLWHELLRQYGTEKLDGAPDGGLSVRDRHSAYYVAALQGWEADLKCARQTAALAEMDVEIDNARAAWDWAVERGHVERIEQAMEALGHFYRWRARTQEGEAAYRAAAEKLGSAASAQGVRVLAKTFRWQGIFCRGLGRIERAGQLLQKSLSLLEDPALAGQDTRSERAALLMEMAGLAPDRNRSRALCERSLALYRALGDRWGMVNALYALGGVAWWSGDYDESIKRREESLSIARALGDQRGIANALAGLSFCALDRGSFEEVERLAQECVTLYREIGDPVSIAWGLYRSGYSLTFLGKFGEARLRLAESLAAFDALGMRQQAVNPLWGLGVAERHLGNYEQARVHGQIMLALSRQRGHPHRTALSLLTLAQVGLAEGAYANAQRLLDESVSIYREAMHPPQLAWVLASAACAACGLGQLSRTRQCLHEALSIATELRSFIPSIHILPAAALLLANEGQAERAVELYALALRHPFVANSRWFEDVVGRHIATAAAGLPGDDVAAARERGRARDLWATAAELLEELGANGSPG